MLEGSLELPHRTLRNRFVRLIESMRFLHQVDDFLALCLSYFFAYAICFHEPLTSLLNFQFRSGHARVYFQHAWVYLLFLYGVIFFTYAIMGMYDGHRRLRRTPILWNAMVGNLVAIGCVAAYLFFVHDRWHMRSFLPLALLLNVPITWVMRHLTNAIVNFLRRRHPSLRGKAIVLGQTTEAELFIRNFRKGPVKGWEIAEQIPIPSSQQELRALVAEKLTDEISGIFVMDPQLSVEQVMDIVRMGMLRNKIIKVLFPHFSRLLNPFISGDEIGGYPIVHFSVADLGHEDIWIRKVGIRTLALIGLILGSPFLALIFLAILSDKEGHPIFVQSRYGFRGAVFPMFKFRTMVVNAEAKLAELRQFNESDGGLFKMREDPRVTPVGGFLRKTSLDELPQLWNILRGDMRLVGPRPLPLADLEPYHNSWHFLRQMCPPGLTCVWQVSGRSEVGFEDMCLLDIWYLLNRDWTLDLRIILRTGWVVLFSQGAY